MAEYPRVEHATIVKPLMVEQTTTTQNTSPPPSEDLQNTSPLPSQDEGYGLDSMIVTPRIPILVEDSTDVGTEEETEIPEETP